MTIQELDIFLRSSLPWRTAGITVCLWIAGVIGFAGLAAYNDGLELYRWTMLGLLLVGLPIAIGATVYAAILLGKKGLKLAFFLIAIFGITIVLLMSYNSYRVRTHPVTSDALSQEMADVSYDKYEKEKARLSALRAPIVSSKDKEHLAAVEAAALAHPDFADRIREQENVAPSSLLGGRHLDANDHLTQKMADNWLKQQLKVKATCAKECAGDPNMYCQATCERRESEVSK